MDPSEIFQRDALRLEEDQAYHRFLKDKVAPQIDRLHLPDSLRGLLQEAKADLLHHRQLSFQQKFLRCLDSLSPTDRFLALEIALDSKNSFLAHQIHQRTIHWPSEEIYEKIRRRTKLLQTQQCPNLAPSLPDRPLPSLRWEAPFLSPSGYGWAARHYVEAAEKEGFPLQARHLVFDPPYVESLASGEQNAWKRRFHQPIDPDRYICSSIPINRQGVQHFKRMRKLNPGFTRYIGFTTYESRCLPKDWPNALRAMDEIWVPSEFNRHVFEEATHGNLPIHILPHGLDPQRYIDRPQLPEVPQEPFIFLSVFEFNPRKGWDLLLDAWTRAFSAHYPVLLYLHVFHPEPGVPESKVRQFLQQKNPSHAPVMVSQKFLSDTEMESLYGSVDAFVLPSRGEGWGIPLMEAMAAGLPTIGPAETGCTDFMNSDNAWLIPGHWRKIPSSVLDTWRMDSQLFANQEWFEPDVDSLTQILREVYEGGSRVSKKANQAQTDIRSRFSLDEIGRLLRELTENPT